VFPIVLFIAWTMNAQAAEQSVVLSGVHVAVWVPEAAGRHPLIIFSHGLHGCSTQSSFLMQAFTAAGYVVLAPDHRDAGCRGGVDEPPQAPLREPELWSEATYRDRADDIRRVIEAAVADDRFAPRVDAARIGLVGHSLGGYTVLGLAGAWPSWRLPGIKAVLALSPYSAPYVVKRLLGRVTVPVMYQGGTLDRGFTPYVRRAGGAYEQSPLPKYYVELDEAGHLAWTDNARTDRSAMIYYSIAFLNRYVRGDAEDTVLTRALPGVSLLRYATERGSGTAGEQGDGPGASPGRLFLGH